MTMTITEDQIVELTAVLKDATGKEKTGKGTKVRWKESSNGIVANLVPSGDLTATLTPFAPGTVDITATEVDPARSNPVAGTLTVVIRPGGVSTVEVTGTVKVEVTGAVKGGAGWANAPAGTPASASPSAPVTASNDGPYHTGDTIHLFTPSVAGASYSWTGPNGFTSTSQNPTITSAIPAMSGKYSVVVTINGVSVPAGSTTVSVTAP